MSGARARALSVVAVAHRWLAPPPCACSAFEDHRFSPLAHHELPHLEITVSLLVDYEPAAHCHDWVIGVHGIVITFVAGGREFSATYLPEVALEQGWTHEETVRSLVRKAGYAKAATPELLKSIATTRYTSSKARATHAEWVSSRQRE